MMRHPIAIAVLGTGLLASSLMQTQAEKQFSATSGVAPSDSTGIELLKLGSRLHSDKQYAEAVAAYDRAAANLPQISDWISVFAAASASYQGDTLEVARRLAGIDTTLAAQWGWRSRVRAFANANAVQRALKLATEATRSGTSSKRAEAWYRVAELQRDLGNRSEQGAALVQAMDVAPASGAAMDAALALIERSDLSANVRVKAGRALMRNGQVTRGVRELERALASGKVQDASQVRYDLGRVLFSVDRYRDAIKHLRLVARGHDRRIDARFLLGRAQYRAGLESAGKQTFRDVADAYPKSSAATHAFFLLGDLAQDDGKTADARSYFEKAAAAPLKTAESSLAMMRLGAIAYAQGDYVKATSLFEQYRARNSSGDSRRQATYWLAQTMLRRGSDTRAKELLHELRASAPLSYYGMRAAELLGDEVVITTTMGPATTPDAQAQVNLQLDRWQLLREVGWNEAAAFELSGVRQRVKDDRGALYSYAEELQRRGAPHVGIETGRALLNDGAGWNQRLLKILYPMPYQDVIEREARARGLDPYFVAALIRQESRFNSKAKSGAGAIGLMQVMPATGRQLGASVGSLTDAETNIKLGTRFLADLVRLYDDRTDLVLAAYNAGPSRADRWRNFPEFAAQDLFIERIPFEETRDYVKVVQLNAAIYRSLYGGQTAGR